MSESGEVAELIFTEFRMDLVRTRVDGKEGGVSVH